MSASMVGVPSAYRLALNIKSSSGLVRFQAELFFVFHWGRGGGGLSLGQSTC